MSNELTSERLATIVLNGYMSSVATWLDICRRYERRITDYTNPGMSITIGHVLTMAERQQLVTEMVEEIKAVERRLAQSWDTTIMQPFDHAATPPMIREQANDVESHALEQVREILQRVQ